LQYRLKLSVQLPIACSQLSALMHMLSEWKQPWTRSY